MSPRRGPQDFLLHLRTQAPFLARRLDGILGMALTGAELLVRAPVGSWSFAELERYRDRLAVAALDFFGDGARVLVEGVAAGERLPLPVLTTKTWNHVAFWARTGRTSVVLTLPKPVYLDEWLANGLAPTEAAHLAGSHPRVRVFRWGAPDGLEGRTAAAWVLPELADVLCGLARGEGSYAQLVSRFPGDEEAEFLEGRLYATKEWGTPDTPGPILQKYVGRLHYASPGLLGLQAAEALLKAVVGP